MSSLRRALPVAGLAAALALLTPFGSAARLVGGESEARTVADPATEMAKVVGSARQWIAWKVPVRAGQTVSCHTEGSWGKAGRCDCSLAEGQHGWNISDEGLASGGDLEIYAAVSKGRITDLLLASEICSVNGTGERVTLLEGVDATRGVALLAKLAGSEPGRGDTEDLPEKALAAIAQHSAVKVPSAPAALAELARASRDAERRGQALFWLAQTRDTRAPGWIRDAILRDPEQEVREQGVFALSQLTDGTDQLLAVIRESRDQAVRRQALFWLGQSNDPRAFSEIERVLLR